MTLSGKTEVLREKSLPVSFCPPQIPHGLGWNRAHIIFMFDVLKFISHNSLVLTCFLCNDNNNNNNNNNNPNIKFPFIKKFSAD
jgi:hypothetical protein